MNGDPIWASDIADAVYGDASQTANVYQLVFRIRERLRGLDASDLVATAESTIGDSKMRGYFIDTRLLRQE